MLGFFRRLINSKVGVVVTFLVLGVIALAFAAGDVTGLGHSAGGMTASNVAEVGKDEITEAELISQTKNALQTIQQKQPTADMAGVIQAGGVEELLDQLIERRAYAQFAQAQGMTVSKRAIDGEIAGIPAFRGVDGKFNQTAYAAMLAQQRVTDQQIRDDIMRERLIQQLTAPANGAAQVSTQFALPYASLLLERRKGSVAFIPAGALGTGTPPGDAELAAFYQRNLARYTVPERRVMRYAIVSGDAVKARAVPTDADLIAAFRADPARFAASEKRTVQTVIVLDQASADAIAAKAKAGAALDATARAAGLEARTLTALDRAALTTQTSAAVTQAVFAAPAGGVIGPLRASGGFTVAKVTAVQNVPARTLDQARAELIPEVTKQKQASLVAGLNDTLDTAASEGSTFDEMVGEQKLTAAKTPALMQNGIDPLQLAVKPDPVLAPVVQAGFASEQGDAPQIVPIGQDGGFALVVLDAVVASAPRPLAEIKPDVARAFVQERALAAARKVATGVVAKLDAGTPIAAALAATGLKLPPVKPVDVPRAALSANPRGAEPALALLFAMAERKAKLLAAPGGAGWIIVWLDDIIPGDARQQPRTVAAIQGDLSRVAGRELVEQFGRAVRDAVGVRRNPDALARAKAQLSGQAPDAQP